MTAFQTRQIIIGHQSVWDTLNAWFEVRGMPLSDITPALSDALGKEPDDIPSYIYSIPLPEVPTT